MGLVSIGEFSRLSPKALRLYDELGLLVPDHVDAATGYRWYADAQLDQARVVALLRRIGVPLAQIRDMLALDPASAAERIRDYWAQDRDGARRRRPHGAGLQPRESGGRPGLRVRRGAALNQEEAVRDLATAVGRAADRLASFMR